jgi:uncharacterized damage-inducible protein DinB
MVWIAPGAVRVDEPLTGGERAMRDGFLDYNRATLLQKCAGLTAEQLAIRPVPPSTLSLLGLVRHVTDVERHWFRRRFGGQDVPLRHRGDAAFDDVAPERAAAELAALLAEQQAARAAVTDLPLEHVWVSPRWGPMSLRWVLQHMSEEYARHCGHADLLRERIDGRTGD